jgi:hypothetical protein
MSKENRGRANQQGPYFAPVASLLIMVSLALIWKLPAGTILCSSCFSIDNGKLGTNVETIIRHRNLKDAVFSTMVMQQV